MKTGTQWMQRGAVVVVIVVALAGAAYLWGNRVVAEVQVAPASIVPASAAQSNLQGLALLRSLDGDALTTDGASQGSLNGVAAVRTADGSSLAGDLRLRGMSAVRAADNR